MVEIDEGMAMLQHSRMEISVRRCGNRRFFLAASLSGRMISVRLRNAVLKPGFKFSVHKLEAGVRLCRIERNEEMLKKGGRFDRGKFDDRYDAALLELVKAKLEGQKMTPPKAPQPTKI